MQKKEDTGKQKTNEERTQDNKAMEEKLQKMMDEDDAVDVAQGKLFDPRDLLLEAKSLHQKYHKRLGLVNYNVLSFDEIVDLGAIKNANERSKTMLWMMLHKAYPDLKKEDIGKLPGVKVAKLLTLITKDEDFLPPETLKPSQSGSKTTRTRK
ncbi:hypothetical protein MUO79_01035 [Candidatus Bathyarchaeota archaeon]|nr:hypothetical protein [Candidatus Bathyarchaeota archaeon]